MSEQKEHGDVEQALNELEESTRLGQTEGIKLANKRLDSMNVSVARRAARLRKLAAEESEEAEPRKAVPQDRKAAPPASKAAKDE